MTVNSSANFDLSIQEKRDRLLLTQTVKNKVVHTHQLPFTYDYLSKNLPTILKNQCFNNQKLPFSEEVKATEIGHLFEHLVLESLKLAVEKDNARASFKGETSWDWSKFGYGTFKITIYAWPKYHKYLKQAINRATLILDNLYLTKR